MKLLGFYYNCVRNPSLEKLFKGDPIAAGVQYNTEKAQKNGNSVPNCMRPNSTSTKLYHGSYLLTGKTTPALADRLTRFFLTLPALPDILFGHYTSRRLAITQLEFRTHEKHFEPELAHARRHNSPRKPDSLRGVWLYSPERVSLARLQIA